MRDDPFDFTPIAITILVVILVIIIPLSCAETKRWNDGVHIGCGGHWQYEQAVGHMYTTSYMYVCDKCGTRTTFAELR